MKKKRRKKKPRLMGLEAQTRVSRLAIFIFILEKVDDLLSAPWVFFFKK
jgi:hypothetical protein